MAKKKKSKGKKAKARAKTPKQSKPKVSRKPTVAGKEAMDKFLIKAATEFGRPVISKNEKPFADADKSLKITMHPHAPPKNYRELLTEDEMGLLEKAIPELSDPELRDDALEAFFRDVYRMGDERMKELTLREIFTFVKCYLSRTPPIKYTLPLQWQQWVYIFQVSPNTLRKWRKEERQYHFDPVGGRRWRLPEHEIPFQYLERYRQMMSNPQTKTQ